MQNQDSIHARVKQRQPACAMVYGVHYFLIFLPDNRQTAKKLKPAK